ncbi:Nramp family divalent metal transporter [Lacticigenium naphthae]|uniref:Nramp family divalent metal transporter n=1 Tax=Lacticigenium naphthae TaxID=515351 RepID=UPI0003F723F4|nr:Nramp family divalent metal transporter [Lacticigenium naphthae]
MKEKRSLKSRLKNLGPAAIVTSAFIGPGTITTATLAGVNYQYDLLWAVVFSCISLAILMEMASRIGIIANKDIVEAAIESFPRSKVWAYFVKILVIVTVVTVAFAFEAGNLIGGALGLADATGFTQWFSALILGLLALIAVIKGTAKTLEKMMLIFVSGMGIIFVFTMLFVKPDIGEVLKGIFIPTMPEGSAIATIALIGTTLIGINLILHSITSAEKWQGEKYLADSRFDINLNVFIGALVTIAIVVTSGTVLFGTGTNVNSPIVFSLQLEPILGSYARIFGDIGISIAGLSSAIATPLVMKVTFSRIFHWDEKGSKAKLAGGSVVVFGTIFAMFGTSPTQIILLAQANSGFFLPFVAILLMIGANNKQLMGEHKNNLLQNILGSISVLTTLGLGIWGLIKVLIQL